MSWGQGADAGSKAGESSAPMASAANAAPAGGSGFTIEPASTAGNTPTDGTMVSQTPNQMQDVTNYGTSNPSTMQQFGSTLERFQKGGGQGLGTTIQKFGNNPETYGAAYGMVSKMAGSGKPGGAVPITTNISTVQADNPYLKKRGRY